MLPLELLQRFESFSWGERDCVHFGLGARQYFGASELVKIPAYGSKYEALKILADGGGMLRMIVEQLGEMSPPSKAQLGDTVYATFRTVGELVGVADPPGFWMLVESGGFVPVSLTLAKGVWPCRR